MRTRIASLDDAEAMSEVLRDIIAQTGRDRPNDIAFVTSHYVAHPASIRCTVAIDETGHLVGFQSLKRAEAGNRFDVPEGRGIIGTHISPRVYGRDVGRKLFASSIEAAERADLRTINASIGADNPSGLGYDEAMGFRTYRNPEGLVQKMLHVENTRRVLSDQLPVTN